MEENQEKKAQEEQVQDPELNVEEQENTDNLSEKEENTDKGKKNIFSRKRDKEKAKVQELEAELEKLKAEKADNIDSIKEGFNLIYNKLLQMMKRFDVEEIQAKGEKFNTDFHEAVTHFPAQKEEDKGKVIDVTEKGYKLKDKVIRYAKVVVGQ